MSNKYRPPSSRRGFLAFGLILGVVAFIALLVVILLSGMFMHGDR